jgi:anion-transporting  ArsA/GET3 family ATPase
VSPATAEPDPAGDGFEEDDAGLGTGETAFGDGDRSDEGGTGGRGPVPADRAAATLPELVAGSSVIVCCGSGGVGKTTVSATFALAAARLGRRSCVVTVDPARRLADALGVESLPNTPAEVKGPWPGRLHALMLDSKGTFDDLVERYARTPEQAESILANRLYQNLAGALSGTQEYMAMEKLYELVTSKEFDIVVVDTPPTRNALDLLDAPKRLTRFLENRLFRALLVPTRISLRAVSVATQALLRTVAKVAGAEIVQDAVAFFQAFEGMEDGFRTRASAVHELLADPGTGYVLVTSARPDAVAEASFFADRLNERDIEVAALVVNRLAPSFGDPDAAGGAAAVPPPVPVPGLEPLEANLAELNAVAALESAAYAELAAQVAPAPVGRIPLFGHDVHELEGLQRAADSLFT